MNILFVNYGDFTTNSLNHIAGFAATLSDLGYSCAVAVAGRKETLSVVPEPRFIPVTYEEMLAGPSPFPDGREADLVHAWTPREGVRRFVLAYQHRARARLIVHLEDNEEHLLERWTGRAIADLRVLSDVDLGDALQDGLPHPVRYRNLLRLADGATVIIDRLREFVPAGTPVHLLTPGVDFSLYRPLPGDDAMRRQLGLRSGEKVIVFTGSNTFANESEVRDLYMAVRLLNQRGMPTRLVRTGLTSPEFQEGFASRFKDIVVDLGFVAKPTLPGLLALADVLVQPGSAGPFNDYRLPSKLPEFLAMGKPVVLPATNLAISMDDGRDGLLLHSGTPEEIADACHRIFTDTGLADQLARHALSFALRHFDLNRNTQGLAAFYETTATASARVDWSTGTAARDADVPVLARQLHDELAHLQDALPKEAQVSLTRFVRQSEDLVLLCRQLVEDAAASPARSILERVEKERDRWRRAVEDVRQHAANLEPFRLRAGQLEQALADSQQHSANLENLLSVARSELDATRQHAANLEPFRLRAGQLEQALADSQRHSVNLENLLAAVRSELDATRQHAANLKPFRLRASQLEQALADSQQHSANLENLLSVARSELDATRQHAANLEPFRLRAGQLEQALADSQRHSVNLENLLAAVRSELDATRQHAANLEPFRLRASQLEQALADSQQHGANLETLLAAVRSELDATRQRVTTLQTDAAIQTSALRKAEQTISLGNWQHVLIGNQLTKAQTTLLSAEERCRTREARIVEQERRIEGLTALSHLREDKVRRMQNSISWQITTPLRWARRLLVDRSHEPQPLPSLATLHVIDLPVAWEAAPAKGEIKGWCVHPDGRPVRGIRARIGSDRELPGTYGLDREDVARAHGFVRPESRACGFTIPYEFPLEATHSVIVEVLSDHDRWHSLVERPLHTCSQPRLPGDYYGWIQSFDQPTEKRLSDLRGRLLAVGSHRCPLVSILMPVFNSPERWLDRAIASVADQTYQNWELCIADDASSEPHVRRVLDAWAERDSRIRVVYRSANGHISAASNSALELARGEFTALLDHDDELPPQALAEMVLFLDAHPETDLLYSDEDKIDESGVRSAPYFKPDFLPDLLLGQNCVSHLSVYRTSVVRAVGGFRKGYEGSQDWDLTLRVWEKVGSGRIRHVPRILYHWRTVAGSTATAVSAKNYAAASARLALADHLKRCGIEASIESVPGNHWRIVYPVPSPAPLVTIIIPTRNAADLVRLCLASIIARTRYLPYEIILIDNGSDAPDALELFAGLEREDNIRVVRHDAPFNYSALNNLGARNAHGAILCFLNNDIEVINATWLQEMVGQAARPEIGAVGAMLYYPDEHIQHAGVILGLGGVANHTFLRHPRGTDGYFNRARLVQNYSAVTGACLAVRREVFDQVGGFDEINLAVAFNDIDFCLRVSAAGYRNLWTPFAELVHHESMSRGRDDIPEKRARFVREVDYMRRTWGPLLDNDPAYNPNLSLSINDGFALAWPPRVQNCREPQPLAS